MKQICMVCGEDVEETVYPAHMDKLHPGGQVANIVAKKNIPKSHPSLPPGINPEDLPTDEFLKTVQEIEQAKVTPPPVPPQSLSTDSPPGQNISVAGRLAPKPVVLTYHYTGECERMHAVSTLELDVAEKHFCVAYCSVCKVQVQSRIVEDLSKQKGKEAKK